MLMWIFKNNFERIQKNLKLLFLSNNVFNYFMFTSFYSWLFLKSYNWLNIVFILLAHSNPTNTWHNHKTKYEPHKVVRLKTKKAFSLWYYSSFCFLVLATTHPNISRDTPAHRPKRNNPRPHTIHHARPVRVFYCLLFAQSTARTKQQKQRKEKR